MVDWDKTIQKMQTKNQSSEIEIKKNPFAKTSSNVNVKVNPFAKSSPGENSGATRKEGVLCKPKDKILDVDVKKNLKSEGKESEKTSTDSFPFSASDLQTKTEGEKVVEQDVTNQLKDEKFPNEAVTQIKKAFQMLQDSFDNKEDVMQIMKIILDMINKNPEGLKPFVMPEDIGLLTKCVRQNYGVAIQKKSTKVAKQQKSNENVETMVDALKGFNLDGL